MQCAISNDKAVRLSVCPTYAGIMYPTKMFSPDSKSVSKTYICTAHNRQSPYCAIIIIITVFIQRLTHRRLVYNGITQVREVLKWRQSAANRKVQPAGSLQPTPPLWCTCPSRSWSQLCCLWAGVHVCEQLTQGCYAVCLGRGSNSRPSDRES